MTDAERRAERSGVRVAAAKRQRAKRQRAKGKRAMTTRQWEASEAAKPMAPPLSVRGGR